MKNYIIHNSEGTILRCGYCQDTDYDNQAQDGEFILEGKANDIEEKIVNGKKVKKTKAEKEKDNPKMKMEDQPAPITNGQLQELFDRIEKLENKE